MLNITMMRAIIRAITYAKRHADESSRILMDWIRVDREITLKSLEIGKNSWLDAGIASDTAIKAVVDQTLAELKAATPVSLDKVRD